MKTTSTFTNCVKGALGLRDVVRKILGFLSAAFAYSSSMVDLGTRLSNKEKSNITSNTKIKTSKHDIEIKTKGNFIRKQLPT